MKPTFHIGGTTRGGESRPSTGHVNQAPVTDWSFQPSNPLVRGGGLPFRRSSRPSLKPFWALSEGFFAAEAKKESRLEGALFAVIVALAAWPMVLAAQAAVALMK